METIYRINHNCNHPDGGMFVGMARKRAAVVDIGAARDRRLLHRAGRVGDLTEYLPTVKRIARLARFSPHCGLTYEDAVQEGFIGLMDAADKWDKGNGKASFATYASYRILGQILDAARNSAWKHRSQPQEHVVTWDKTETIPDEASGPSELADTDRSLRRILAGEMSPREKTIWCGLFEKGLTMRACGESLGITETRVLQIRDRMLARLRKRV